MATNLGSGGGGGAPRGTSQAVLDEVQMAFAHSIQTVFYVMAAVLAVTFLIALVALPAGRSSPTEPADEAVPEAAPA